MMRHTWVIILAAYGVSFALLAYAESIGLGMFIAALYYLPISVLGCIVGRSSISFASVCLSWLANPVLWVGLMLLAKERWQEAARAGLVAALLASNPLLTQDYLHGLGIGYFAWLASMILLIAMSLAGWMFSLRVRQPSGIAGPSRVPRRSLFRGHQGPRAQELHRVWPSRS
jgi:hypothetical protein